jgi:uncharacterized membrane protein
MKRFITNLPNEKFCNVFKMLRKKNRLHYMDMTHILFAATLVALLLVCGVFWGLYFALSRSYEVFSAAELAKIARTIVTNLEVPMRNISLVCLALLCLSIAFYPEKSNWEFDAMITSLMLLVGALIITTAIEVPINRQVVTWTDENTPGNWQNLRGRWQYFNVFRMVLALMSFALFAIAATI